MDLSRILSETEEEKIDALLIEAQIQVERSLKYSNKDEEWTFTLSDIQLWYKPWININVFPQM